MICLERAGVERDGGRDEKKLRNPEERKEGRDHKRDRDEKGK